MIYEKELSDKIIGCAIEVHKKLGNGFLGKVYENALLIELKKSNLRIKSCYKIHDINQAQLINYHKATSKKVGYIINFGSSNKLEFKRIVF